MVFGIIDNFANQFQDTTEAFENQENDDISNDTNRLDLDLLNKNSIKEPFQTEGEKTVDDEEKTVDDEEETVDDEEKTFDDEEETVDDEEDSKSFNNLVEGFNNYNVVEGFTGGDENDYNSHKLILKSILFGLLFFVLSNSKIYAITKPLTKGLDRQVIHALIFTVIYYIVNTVIN